MFKKSRSNFVFENTWTYKIADETSMEAQTQMPFMEFPKCLDMFSKKLSLQPFCLLVTCL